MKSFRTKFSNLISVWILGIKKNNTNVLKIYLEHCKNLRDQIFNEFFFEKMLFDCVPKFSRIEWDIKKPQNLECKSAVNVMQLLWVT